MPRGDGSGPLGRGSMTGRAAGYCAGYDMPGSTNPGSGYGFGTRFGRGRRSWCRGYAGAGRGRRNGFHATGRPGWMRFGDYPAPYAPSDPEMERRALKSQADALKSELDFIQKRLAEMDTGAPTE